MLPKAKYPAPAPARARAPKMGKLNELKEYVELNKYKISALGAGRARRLAGPENGKIKEIKDIENQENQKNLRDSVIFWSCSKAWGGALIL